MTLLAVEDLHVGVVGSGQPVIEGVSFGIEAGGRVGLIGESGSGKSLTALAVLGLLPPTMSASGSVRLDGVDMISGDEARAQRVRGRVAAMVFQEPLSALDPLMKAGRQVAGPLKLHHGIEGDAARRETLELFHRVRLPDPRRIADSFPHELSGGQRQRVAIAMALACRPRLLIADEPTTALDVTVQADVLALLDELVTETGMALLFITHDLPVVARVARLLLVMDAGRIVEAGDTESLLSTPRHPTTRRLLDAARRVVLPGSER